MLFFETARNALTKFSAFFLCALLLLLSACVGPQHRWVLDHAASVKVEGVPFHPQKEFHCGPAAMATLLNFSGIDVSPDELAKKIYVPDKRGTFQSELISVVRGYDKLAAVVPGDIRSIFSELESGHPVLIFQNLGVSHFPVWHYAVVVAYDQSRKKFTLRSGTEREHEMSVRKFLVSWQAAGFWAIALADAEHIPASLRAADWVKTVAPLESTGKNELAAKAYKTGLKRWPDSAEMHAAVAGVYYQENDLMKAAAHLRAATLIQPKLIWPRNNYAFALSKLGCFEQAKTEIATAKKLATRESDLALIAGSQAEIKASTSAASDSVQPNFCAQYATGTH